MDHHQDQPLHGDSVARTGDEDAQEVELLASRLMPAHTAMERLVGCTCCWEEGGSEGVAVGYPISSFREAFLVYLVGFNEHLDLAIIELVGTMGMISYY